VIKPKAKALDLFQGVKFISLGYLLPTMNAIHKALNEIINVNLCKPLVIALKRGLSKRYYKYYILFRYLLAVINVYFFILLRLIIEMLNQIF